MTPRTPEDPRLKISPALATKYRDTGCRSCFVPKPLEPLLLKDTEVKAFPEACKPLRVPLYQVRIDIIKFGLYIKMDIFYFIEIKKGIALISFVTTVFNKLVKA